MWRVQAALLNVLPRAIHFSPLPCSALGQCNPFTSRVTFEWVGVREVIYPIHLSLECSKGVLNEGATGPEYYLTVDCAWTLTPAS